jgi:hypothetical protein
MWSSFIAHVSGAVENGEKKKKEKKKKRKLMRGRRTCRALRGRLAFPPYVLIVHIDIVVVVLFPVIVIAFFAIVAPAATTAAAAAAVLVLIALHPRGGAANRFLSRRRRRRCRCVADGCAWMAHAIRAEPLAVWDSCQGRREARVVIRFIALRARV